MTHHFSISSILIDSIALHDLPSLFVLLPTITQKRKREFIKEALALSKLDHPLIGKLEAVFIDGTNGFLQMTHYRGGSLTDYLKHQQSKNNKIDLRLTWTLFAKISQTLAHIHDRGIIHCDINVS